MKRLIIVFGILLFTNCSPKADIDAYVNESCECINNIDVEKIDKSAIAEAIYNCADFANNQDIYQELITQYMDANLDTDYVTAEKNAPKIIDAKLLETCPSYKKLVEKME